MILKKYKSIEKIENGYIINVDETKVKLVFMSDSVIRVRVSFNGDFTEESYALVTTAWEDRLDSVFERERTRIEALDIDFVEDDNKISFKTDELTLCMCKEPFGFTLFNKQGECIHKDLPERAYEKDYLGRVSHFSSMDRDFDHYYGFGEKTGHLDKKGRRLRMSPKDAIGHDPVKGDPMYKHIPFYTKVNENNLHAVGLFYDNSYDCVFDMGQEISGYWERYNYWQADGGNIDFYFISGPTIAEVVEKYTWLTGTTAMPTKQSLGYCASTMYYAELRENCDEEIYKVIDKHIKENIYIDNFWLASGYSTGEEDGLRYTFNWNKKRFPDPEKFFSTMNDKGINVICNLKPGVLENHPYAEYYEQKDAYIKTADGKSPYYGRWWGGTGRFIDFTGEKGRQAWKELLKTTILEKGTKTVWNDNCEMDGVEDKEAKCDFEGKTGDMAQLKIIHSNMMAYLGCDAISEVYPNERPYVINRAGYAGIQRYAQVWGGDNITSWDTVKYNIATIVGMGISGCANMGCDIGGFTSGAPEGELLLRWIQSGIFQPRFTINSANNDNTVTQPWMYDENLEHVQKAYELRYKMLPYLYSLMNIANEKGTPVMRPLFMEFPLDKKCYNDEYLTFMFGPSILVANVVEKGAKTRKLYLPEGANWYDMNDRHKEYSGGQVIEVSVDYSSIPMFLRSDAIFFTTDDVKHILKDKMKSIDLLISADKDVSFTLYDDDGHTQDFENGVFSKTKINVSSGDRKIITFEKEGDYVDTLEKVTLKVLSKTKGAYWVTVDGEKIPQFMVSDNWSKAESGWYYNLSDKTIWVKYNKPNKSKYEVVVSTEKFDLIGMGDE